MEALYMFKAAEMLRMLIKISFTKWGMQGPIQMVGVLRTEVIRRSNMWSTQALYLFKFNEFLSASNIHPATRLRFCFLRNEAQPPAIS